MSMHPTSLKGIELVEINLVLSVFVEHKQVGCPKQGAATEK